MISISCTGCGKAYKLDNKLSGKKVRCKGCQSTFVVSAPVADDFTDDDDDFEEEAPPVKPKKRPSKPADDDPFGDLGEAASQGAPLAKLPKLAKKPASAARDSDEDRDEDDDEADRRPKRKKSSQGFKIPGGGVFSVILAGGVGGAIGAVIWGLISYFTQHEIGWIAWGVGGLVGLGVRSAADEVDDSLAGILAGVLAVVSVFAGKYLGAVLVIYQLAGQGKAPEGVPHDLLSICLLSVIVVFVTLGPMDLLFFGLAIYTAYKLGSGQSEH